MDKLEEVKKLKNLLDDGIIDEEDFKRKKAQILELYDEKTKESVVRNVENVKEDSKTKSKSLDDYEKELMAEIEKEKVNEKFSTKENDEYYQKEVVARGINKTQSILKWVVAVILWIFGAGAIGTAIENGISYIFLGIILLIQGCMACPKITEKTKKYKRYTMYKTAIVWVTVILWIILAVAF